MSKQLIGTLGLALSLVAAMAFASTAQAQLVSDTTTYVLDKCPVTGNKLDPSSKPIAKEIDGREIRFCCPACPAKFEVDKAKYNQEVDKAIVAKERDAYPLDTCVVTGKKLGEGGAPVDYVYGNRLIRFCSGGCVAEFKKDPAKYVAKIDAAILEKSAKTYPLDKCVVMGNALPKKGGPDLVIGNRLVRLCCSGCVASVKKNPLKYFTMLDDAAAAKGGQPEQPKAGGAATEEMSHH